MDDEEKREANLEVAKRYRQSKKGRAIRKRYEQSTQFKDAQRKYGQSEKGKARDKRYCNRYPNRRKARTAVNNAIFTGKMPHPDTSLCMNCFEQAQDYHHYSYEPENWLKVFPVCKRCHRKIHREIA